jgi:hypothetical protein
LLSLVEPALAYLSGYEAAGTQGWSPGSVRDVSGEHAAAIRADAPAFIMRWMWDQYRGKESSRKVIEGNGGSFVEEFEQPQYGDDVRLRFRVNLQAEDGENA